jgi:hypothetical protein
MGLITKFSDACLVEVASSSRQDVKSSASGILIDPQQGLVLSSAQLLLNLLPVRAFQALLAKSALSAKWFTSVSVGVTLRATGSVQDAGYSTGLINVYVSGGLQPKHPLLQRHGKICLAWKVPNFASTMSTLFPTSNGWSFHENPDKLESGVDKEKLASLLPYFVLIKIANWVPQTGTLKLAPDQPLPGDVVYAVGTPFGNLSALIFLNSTSTGIVCNIAGAKKETILIDARCIPGTEGGVLYNAKRYPGLLSILLYCYLFLSSQRIVWSDCGTYVLEGIRMDWPCHWMQHSGNSLFSVSPFRTFHVIWWVIFSLNCGYIVRTCKAFV